VDAVLHETFRFRLRGAHRATPCAACHRELAAPAEARVVTLIAGGGTFRPSRFTADTVCASCHASVHGTQFAGRKGGSGCEVCHGEDSFAPAARFDHDRDAAFPLGKGHRGVACVACHRATQLVEGVQRVVYRPLSGKCESCHLKRPG
jgi:hypothetical protein